MVTGSAQVAGFFLSFGGATLNLGGAATDDGKNSTFVIEVAGVQGSREFSFASGTAITDIVNAINSFTDVTGVRAIVSGTGISISSPGFGSSQFTTVRVLDSGEINLAVAQAGIYDYESANTNASLTTGETLFAVASNRKTDLGADMSATINGIRATTDGTVARINTDFLDVEIDLETGTASGAEAQRLGALTAFRITGGGADFQLAPKVDITGKVSIGIGDLAVRNIGRADIVQTSGINEYFLSDIASGRALNVVDGDLSGAQEVVIAAIKDVTSLRGRLGAFQRNVIGSTIRSLSISFENTTAAESLIRDTDFANETSRLTRSQVLVSASTQVLALANSQPQSALQLLG